MKNSKLKEKHRFIEELRGYYLKLKQISNSGYPFFLSPLFEQEHEKGIFNKNKSSNFPPRYFNFYLISPILYLKFIFKLFKYSIISILSKLIGFKCYLSFKNRPIELLWITYSNPQIGRKYIDIFDCDFKKYVIPKKLNSQIIFIPISMKIKDQVITTKRYSKYNYLNLFLFFSPFSFLIEFIRCLSIFSKTHKINHPEFSSILNKQIFDGQFLDSLVIDCCWRTISKQLNKTLKTVVYPFENLNWEKSLNFHLSKFATTIGFIHCTIPQYYINFFLNIDGMALGPRKISYNNQLNYDLLHSYWLKTTHFFPGGHLRGELQPNQKNLPSYNKIAFIFPLGISQCHELEKIISSLPDTIAEAEWEVKPHPNSIYNLKKGALAKKVTTAPTPEILGGYRAAIISNSSTFVDAIQYGLPFIILKTSFDSAEAAEDLLPSHFYCDETQLLDKIIQLIKNPSTFTIQSTNNWQYISPRKENWSFIQ